MKRAVFEQVYKEQNAIKTHSLVLLYMRADKVGKASGRSSDKDFFANNCSKIGDNLCDNFDSNGSHSNHGDCEVVDYCEVDSLNFLYGSKFNQVDAGFVVTKKISKLAVKRNKIRRQLRSLFRENLDKLPKNMLYVFLVRKVKSAGDTKAGLELDKNARLQKNGKNKSNSKELNEFNIIPDYKTLKRDFEYIVKKIGLTVKWASQIVVVTSKLYKV